MKDFYGYPNRKISSDFLELDCLTTAGPRVVGLSYKGSPNLFAEVPQISVPTPFGDYHYLGGHRLWHAPESMPASYIPDDEGLHISELPDGFLLDGMTERLTGIQKRIEIRLDPHKARATLAHTLFNRGTAEVELAPWALTMFRLGGIAVLPIRASGESINQLVPDRHFSLWPYSRIDDPRLHIGDEFVLVEAMTNLPPLKIGVLDPPGWIAYWLDGVLFRKVFETKPGVKYPDFDCNAEIYCDENFIELESLGPLCRLAAGASVSIDEVWEVFESPHQDFMPEELVVRLTGKS